MKNNTKGPSCKDAKETPGGCETRRFGIIGAVLALTSLAMCGCFNKPPHVAMRIWAVPDNEIIDVQGAAPKDSPVFDEAKGAITLAAAINETISFQLVLRNDGDALIGAAPVFTALTHGDQRLEAEAFSFFRPVFAEVDEWPGWHVRLIPPSKRQKRVQDALVPFEDAAPTTLRSGERLLLWVDVAVPKGTTPGTYEGAFQIVREGAPAAAVPVTLTVWPFALPDKTPVALLGTVDHSLVLGHHLRVNGRPYAPTKLTSDDPHAAAAMDLLNQTVSLLHDHKVTVQLDRLFPILKPSEAGSYQIGWEDYDRLVGGWLTGEAFADREGLPWWPIPFSRDFPPAPAYGGINSPTYSKNLRGYLSQCAAHFEERGWLDRSYVQLPCDPAEGRSAGQVARHFAHIVQLADERLAGMAGLIPQDPTAYGWVDYAYEDIRRDVRIWRPPAQFADPAELADLRRMGCGTWFEIGSPPYSGTLALAAPLGCVCVLPWQAAKYGANAVWLGDIAAWSSRFGRDDPVENRVAGREPLIYPGRFADKDAPVPTLRLKLLRRAMQDQAYAELLRRHNLSHVADLMTQSLCRFAGTDAYGSHFADGRPGGWEMQPRWWNVARQLMAEELAQAVDAAEFPQGPSLTSTVRWREFLEATRRLRIKVEGVRVRAADADETGSFEVQCLATIDNQTRSPTGGTLRLADLPIGWETPSEGMHVPAVPAGEHVAVAIVARTPALAGGAMGHVDLPVVFEPDAGETVTATARVSIMAAMIMPSDPRIDGDLGDWPLGIGNAAGAFTLISDPAAPATNATVCFAGIREDRLFLAFNCAASESVDKAAAGSNVVAYQDMAPIGEELIEVLIDPANAGTYSVARLYHIVIKPGGAWLSEKGIGCYPPIGAHGPWPSGIASATRVSRNGWTAELSVPLAAFDRTARPGQVWGINFARFDRHNQEYSNWSGAGPTLYSPESLGNMSLP